MRMLSNGLGPANDAANMSYSSAQPRKLYNRWNLNARAYRKSGTTWSYHTTFISRLCYFCAMKRRMESNFSHRYRRLTGTVTVWLSASVDNSVGWWFTVTLSTDYDSNYVFGKSKNEFGNSSVLQFRQQCFWNLQILLLLHKLFYAHSRINLLKAQYECRIFYIWNPTEMK